MAVVVMTVFECYLTVVKDICFSPHSLQLSFRPLHSERLFLCGSMSVAEFRANFILSDGKLETARAQIWQVCSFRFLVIGVLEGGSELKCEGNALIIKVQLGV